MNWTALTAVKVACFLLIIVMAFITLNRFDAIDSRVSETGLGTDIIAVDRTPEEAFHNRFIDNANYFAGLVLYFGSEESILAGEHLRWMFDPASERFFDYHDDYGNVEIAQERNNIQQNYYNATLLSTNGQFQHVWLNWNENTEERRALAEQNAIREQLNSFRGAMRFLNETEGLVFRIYDRTGNIITNTTGNMDWFASQAVHLIYEDGTIVSTTQGVRIWNWRGWEWTHFLWSYNEHGEIVPFNPTYFLAFTNDVVGSYRTLYIETREGFIRDFTIMAIAFGIAMFLFVVLMLGAGRKFGVPKEEGVHFSAIDTPFLDVTLAGTIIFCILCLSISISIIGEIWRHAWLIRNQAFVNIIYALISVAVITPILGWFISFAKRAKAGQFWKHTLIYYIPSRILDFIKSLWAGFKLTPKVALISLIAFCMMLFVGIFGAITRSGGAAFAWALAFTALIVVLLFRYARRIHTLEQVARKVSEGSYDEKAHLGGGELGSIAHSINNISEGINKAVEERMKSERLKTELITNVSHDIRTPLTSIISYTDLLQKEGLDSKNAPEYLEILIQKSQRLKTLTDELFEAAKASTGNIDVNIENLDLVSLINQVVGELDSAIKNSGLDLRVNLPESVYVRADGRLMWRVLENLFSNVFKYSLPGSRVYIDVFEEDMYIRVDMKNISSVELNIDPSELMDRFKRGDDSRADGGSGLGLSIVQSFVAAQGGKFHIVIDGDLFKASILLPPM